MEKLLGTDASELHFEEWPGITQMIKGKKGILVVQWFRGSKIVQ